MKNYTGPGKVITITAAAAQTSGDVIQVVDLLGVVSNTVAIGEQNELCLEGEYDLGKTAALAIAQGDKVYWNSTTKLITKTNTDVIAGYCTKAALAADTKVRVKLFPF